MDVPPLEEFLRGKVFFVNQLKAIMEFYGIYHEVTANMINHLSSRFFRQGIERIGGEEHRFIYDTNLSSIELDMLCKRNRVFYSKFLGILTDNRYSGFFAESMIFLALCKTRYSFGNQIAMHILQPEQTWINGISYKIEFPINVAGEVFGIEVKNNYMQLSPLSETVQALLNPELPFNPVLINRQSTKGIKSIVMRNNGRVTDLTRLLLMKHEDSHVFSDLGLNHIATFLPEIDVAGTTYNGITFKHHIRQFAMDDLIKASVQVPMEVQAKINGLVALLHLAVKFRQARSLRRGRRAKSMCLALLLQNAYTYLLGAKGQYRSIDDCFDYASGKISGILARYLTRNLNSLKVSFREGLEDLKTERLVKRRLSNYRVDGFMTPENWLKRDP